MDKRTFRTSDGFTLTYDPDLHTWSDGDLTFASDPDHYDLPVDDGGELLEGTEFKPVVPTITVTKHGFKISRPVCIVCGEPPFGDEYCCGHKQE